ncbi:glycerol transporter [Vanrija albida]|uniref:Glycerol transporter n=1 Tax=Vanrija albida TaxID=181172 RepID=A0ABR3PZG9_9TREE
MIPSHRGPHGAFEVVDPDTASHKCNVTDLTVSTPGNKRRAADDAPPPPRWRTREFYFYYVVFVLVVPMLIYWPMRLSTMSNQNYWTYAHKLSPGWMYGRQVDASDGQYRNFRSNIGSLALLSLAFLVPSHIVRRAGWKVASSRARFIAAFAVVMLMVLHGIGVLKVLAILVANYYAAKATKPAAIERFWPAVVVVANMAILFANWKFDGYHFGALHSALGDLDALTGILPRWHIGFNITMLRIVSFAVDYHWRAAPPTSPPTDHRGRTGASLPESDYSLVNFIAYALYPPLYIAGPILTFQDFMWQLHRPLDITTRERVSYAFRFLFCLLTMESILHTMYVTAIKDTRAWQGASPADLSMIGFWNLVIVWLKLLIPWRFFRLWSLFDGIDPPENMIRCVANNYSTLGFWRSWHRSYNLWVVRYIYIPLGGSKNMILATLTVFTFVALWHDLSFKLLAWGWLISLFILPELIGRFLVPASKYGGEWWYRHVAAAGGVVNVLLMMSANLVGFVLGVEDMWHLVYELISTWNGWLFFTFASSCLFIGVQVMFEYREEEARRGIDRRC